MKQKRILSGKFARVLSISLLVPFLVSCAYDTKHVRLPSGYLHDGIKAVLIRPADAENYFDVVAATAMKDTVSKFKYLFKIVYKTDDAELDMIVSGQTGTLFKVASFGAAAEVVSFRQGTAVRVDSTDLNLQMFDRERGKIYEAHFCARGHPNLMLANAAEHLMVYYSIGK